MTSELLMVRSLRRVLESASDGEGVARAVVKELRAASVQGAQAARMVLLGHAIRVSMAPFARESSDEAAILAALIVDMPRSSASLVGRSGGALAGTLEKWVKAKDNRRLERRVMRFRSTVTSGVLGAVTAMGASLGPLVGSLGFAADGAPPDPTVLLAGAAAMAAISSAMLGRYLAGRGLLVNVAVTLLVFALVGAVASPLASVPVTALWGVK